ncbi:hypothetical protein OC845_006264 [Tilletia horrida]|nr:hypothetical protein OC845_006264 [Tilletia horrida]
MGFKRTSAQLLLTVAVAFFSHVSAGIVPQTLSFRDVPSVANLTNATAQAVANAAQQKTMIRGVNLGGFLVIESFITPTLFSRTNNSAIVDEWTFSTLQPRDQAARLLQGHLDSFITERDLAMISDLGLNHIRLPIPFYAIDVAPDEPYLKLNRWELAKQVVRWAGKHNVRVIVDLHSLPGGQNGYDHSGKTGQNLWASNQTYFDRSLAIVKIIASEFSKPEYGSTVIAIEPVNEPVTNLTRVAEYYSHSRDIISSASNSTIVTLMDDGGPQNLDSWRTRPAPHNMSAMSSHPYLVFNDADILSNRTEKVEKICALGKMYQKFNDEEMYLVVDEWTPAFTDCAVNLNGRGRGSRYDGSFPGSKGRRATCQGKVGPGSSFSAGYKQMLGLMWEAQVVSYERAAGWMQWTWKTEPGFAEDWSYLAGVVHGWIPQDPTERRFNVTCP